MNVSKLAPVALSVGLLGVVGGVAAAHAFQPTPKSTVHLVQPAAQIVTPTDTVTVTPIATATTAAPKPVATTTTAKPAPVQSTQAPAPTPVIRKAAAMSTQPANTGTSAPAPAPAPTSAAPAPAPVDNHPNEPGVTEGPTGVFGGGSAPSPTH